MSDLGVPVPVLTPSGIGAFTPLTPAQPASRPVTADGGAVPTAEDTADPITGQPTAALSAGLAVVLQNLEAGADPGDPQDTDPFAPPAGSPLEFQPVDPVEAAVEALTDLSAGEAAAGIGAATAPTTAGVVATAAQTPSQRSADADRDGTATATETDAEQDAQDPAARTGSQDVGPDGLTEEERRVVAELQRIDAEVRRHEQAHAAVGGPYAGAPAYQTVRGPDGRLYAVGGEVQIDVSDIPGNPEATIRKLQVVRRAALAPAQPSAADRRVASIAQQGIAEARQELREQRLDEQQAASDAREESAVRREQLQPTDAVPSLDPTSNLTPLRLGIPTLVRSSGPFVSPSQILSVIA